MWLLPCAAAVENPPLVRSALGVGMDRYDGAFTLCNWIVTASGYCNFEEPVFYEPSPETTSPYWSLRSGSYLPIFTLNLRRHRYALRDVGWGVMWEPVLRAATDSFTGLLPGEGM